MALHGWKPPKKKKERPPMAPARASASVGGAEPIQSLNTVEEKLRREFNLAGQIGASLKRELTPVIIAGDLRDMGHASNQGRGFAVTSQLGTGWAANGHYSFLFNADVLIEAFYFTTSGGDDVALYYTTPTEAIPAVAATASGAWRDRKLNTSDAPPIFTSAASQALAGTAISNSNRLLAFRTDDQHGWFPMQIMVPAGGALTVRCTGGLATSDFGFWGRIWP